ncbi:MAG TPA: SWIM zinc finger family protein [Candidatus Xenobia bacterium]|jgi:hypothetical protein
MAVTTRETVDQKAHRLIQEGRITWAQGVAVVAGDHQTYMVKRQGGTWSCSCPWGTERPDSKPCSHVIAAALTAPAVAPQVPPAPAPAPKPEHPVDTVDRLLADLKASLGLASPQRPTQLPQPRPSHTVTPMPTQPRLPRNIAKRVMLVKVTDPQELAALRHVANPSVRYIEQDGVHFAVCEQAVLDVALTLSQGVCR